MEKYIKMNDNDNYLSLGNLFNSIKKNSKVIASSVQSEIFCLLFNIEGINNTTVNNYLIGYRPIGLEYKKIYIEFKDKYINDKDIFMNIICKLVSVLEEKIYKNIVKDDVNNNNRLKRVCSDLINISKNDIDISSEFINNLQYLYDNNKIYECFIELLFYAILENKQPRYINKINIDYNSLELNEYLKINLYEGISYISSLSYLATKNNMYANAELGSLEYSGLISGKIDYEKSFNHYMLAANKNHPKACWMVAYLILNKLVKETNKDIAWDYLYKAEKLGSIASLNTLGKCFMTDNNPNGVKDIERAMRYFNKAIEYGYTYSYNNIGLYYEKENNIEKALDYYKISADLNNSWAMNKVGEILRKSGNVNDAYFYYLKSSKSPLNEKCYYSYYNLAKYYYACGNKELNIDCDNKLALKYLKKAYKNGVKEAYNIIKKIEK